MNPTEPQRECLLRCLEGGLSPGERARVVEWLRADAAARAFLREVAEQSVMIADLERIAAGRREELHPRPTLPEDRAHTVVPANFISWRQGLAAAAVLCLLAALVFQFWPAATPGRVQVAKATGSSQYFGADGRVETALKVGTVLGVGDTLETRSCDAWIELALHDGSTMTIAGHSTLRILNPQSGTPTFKLQQGNLWVSPANRRPGRAMFIQTPMVTVAARGAQFDIQTSTTDTMLRVNEGSTRVTQPLDGSTVEVTKGRQMAASLGRREPITTTPQPGPINYWACDLGQIPEVILGRWLPPTANERARLRADPLLWRIPGRDPVMLYAVALAAWKSTERPVLLQSGSRLHIRGRTELAHTVRFGFSTQRMRGVFAGKFEVDVVPDSLGPVGETWEVELPLSAFRPLHPQLSASPDGLELTDIYALTVKEDAGLEINHFELLPRQGADQ